MKFGFVYYIRICYIYVQLPIGIRGRAYDHRFAVMNNTMIIMNGVRSFC